MKLVLTDHLKARLGQRKIPLELVEENFEKSEEAYWDNLRNHYVVISLVKHNESLRKVIAAYDRIGEDKEVIAVHHY
ncbi:MAG: hypothetical protein EXR50_01040 [Dehalococcoidia bacterium]|nr:hypothetical protein [Dehalococcoidia bacterium]